MGNGADYDEADDISEQGYAAALYMPLAPVPWTVCACTP